MKTIIFTITILFFLLSDLKSQDSHSYELRILNESTNYLYVKFYPVSMVFSGYSGSVFWGDYTPLAFLVNPSPTVDISVFNYGFFGNNYYNDTDMDLEIGYEGETGNFLFIQSGYLD